MKRAGQALLCAMFTLLLLLSFRALVETPEKLENPRELSSSPVHAVLKAAATEAPAQARAVIAEGEAVQRRIMPLHSAASVPVNAPVRDGNGIPLLGRSYVRTVYTACRLEETSG